MSRIREADLQRLQAYLLEHLETSGCMPLDVAHGFLTAVVSSPRPLPRDVWLAPVLGRPAEPQEQWLADVLIQLYQTIEWELKSGEFGPMIIYKPLPDQEPLPLPYGWCEGYLLGLDLHGSGVAERLAGEEQTAAQLAPILAFMMYEESQLLNPPDPAAHRELATELAGSAMQLYRCLQTQQTVTLQ